PAVADFLHCVAGRLAGSCDRAAPAGDGLLWIQACRRGGRLIGIAEVRAGGHGTVGGGVPLRVAGSRERAVASIRGLWLCLGVWGALTVGMWGAWTLRATGSGRAAAAVSVLLGLSPLFVRDHGSESMAVPAMLAFAGAALLALELVPRLAPPDGTQPATWKDT